jgi:hypothetical protein
MLHALARYLSSHDFRAECDPPTRKLLLEKYDDVTCCFLFPKRPNNRSHKVASEMRAAAARANRSHDSSTREVIVNRVLQLHSQYGNSVTGRKVDLVVESPLGTLNKLVGDLTIRHPTAPPNIALATKFCSVLRSHRTH